MCYNHFSKSMEVEKMTNTRNIRLDVDTDAKLKELDQKMNLKPNYSAVVRLAIQRLYEAEVTNRK